MIKFDAFQYVDKPDLGLNRIVVAYWGNIKDFSNGAQIDYARLGNKCQEALDKDCPFVLDIERWKIGGVNDTVTQESVEKYVEVILWIKAKYPGLRITAFGLPLSQYSNVIYTDTGYAEWLRKLEFTYQISELLDFITISAYPNWDKADDWMNSIDVLIKVAKTYNKRVYAWITPEYTKRATLNGYISRCYWYLCRNYLDVDGLIYWGGYKKPWVDVEI